MILLQYLFALLPISLFLLLLLWMDSFSLTRGKRLVFAISAGVICYLVAAFWLGHWSEEWLAPVVDEVLKGLIVWLMIRRRKIALTADATIYGSAIGAGFAFAKSVIHLSIGSSLNPSLPLLEAVMVGLEGAVMHIGCTSTLAMMLVMVWQGRFGSGVVRQRIAVVIAFALAILIHFVHSNAPVPESVMLVILIVYFVISKRSLFKKNERFVHAWIDDCINNEVALLGSIHRGQLATTNAGQYLLTLKDSFNGETFFDMCCYVSLYLELSIASKSNLILAEAGLERQVIPDYRAKLSELAALRKRIGKTGVLALAPIVNAKEVDKWAVESQS